MRRVQARIAAAANRVGRRAEDVTLVAVTKGVDAPMIRGAFAAGARHFGENRVQEARTKIEQMDDLRDAATWHMIGNLQSNKAKEAVRLFAIIQSVASVELSERLNRAAVHRLPVFLEVNVAGEPTKHGFLPDALPAAVERLARFTNLEIRGLMTVAPATSDPAGVRPVFRRLRGLGESLGLKELSMGMTDDFEVAVEEGATMVRIGRAIFGERTRVGL
ncbi:MAG: YggS family pyridoxal phosphate-dependent enzyme [Chloroflexi bacterium]|nr:YggS family pyridoxal phosphate-dependent enzyme [Chloroflexota bacterium]